MSTSTMNIALICIFTFMITLSISGTVTRVETVEATTNKQIEAARMLMESELEKLRIEMISATCEALL